MGRPMRSITAISPRSILKLSGLKSKPKRSFRRYSRKRENSRDTPCPITVAKAVPAAPISKETTKIRSPARLIAAAMAIKSSGLLASPMPRSTELTAL